MLAIASAYALRKSAKVIDLAAVRITKHKPRRAGGIERHFAQLEREYWRHAAAAERKEPRQCAWCNVFFVPESLGRMRIWCSDECRWAADKQIERNRKRAQPSDPAQSQEELEAAWDPCRCCNRYIDFDKVRRCIDTVNANIHRKVDPRRERNYAKRLGETDAWLFLEWIHGRALTLGHPIFSHGEFRRRTKSRPDPFALKFEQNNFKPDDRKEVSDREILDALKQDRSKGRKPGHGEPKRRTFPGETAEERRDRRREEPADRKLRVRCPSDHFLTNDNWRAAEMRAGAARFKRPLSR